jgi:hypothetical protein
MVLIGSSRALVALLSGFLLAISSGVVNAQFSSNVVSLTARNWRQEVEGTRSRHVFIIDSTVASSGRYPYTSYPEFFPICLSIQSLHTLCLLISAAKDEVTANNSHPSGRSWQVRTREW